MAAREIEAIDTLVNPPVQFLIPARIPAATGANSSAPSNLTSSLLLLPRNTLSRRQDRPVQLSFGAGAGEGNRTLVCSLGSCRSTIELRPRSQLLEVAPTGATAGP